MHVCHGYLKQPNCCAPRRLQQENVGTLLFYFLNLSNRRIFYLFFKMYVYYLDTLNSQYSSSGELSLETKTRTEYQMVLSRYRKHQERVI
jgi:hypothetical protein